MVSVEALTARLWSPPRAVGIAVCVPPLEKWLIGAGAIVFYLVYSFYWFQRPGLVAESPLFLVSLE